MKKYQKEALKLAKNSILEKFWKANLYNFIAENDELNEKKACFITIKTWKKSLRWCIWSIFAHRVLYKDIISNAKSAAFSDPRFSPLTKQEFDDLFLEITILTPLEEKKFENIEWLFFYLNEKKPWLVLSLLDKEATFLPSVWNEINHPLDFITHLIYKAWITDDEFINQFNKVIFLVYFWEEFWEWFKNI